LPSPFASFNACPRCAAPTADDERPNPFRCGRCGFVLHFNPVGAVAAFIVRPDDGFVLYTRRAREPGKGKLGMPGGFVDFGETAEGALAREVREEVGLDLDWLGYLTSCPNDYPYNGVTYQTLDLFFVARAADHARVQPLDAVASTCWLDPAGIDPAEIAFESMRRAREVFLSRPDLRPPA
jgi:ADP-ribose pyrophosphatase YjhB (NUDIX family)